MGVVGGGGGEGLIFHTTTIYAFGYFTQKQSVMPSHSNSISPSKQHGHVWTYSSCIPHYQQGHLSRQEQHTQTMVSFADTEQRLAPWTTSILLRNHVLCALCTYI